ncbi:MAG TPA: CPBP family intramembrane glutamic endopeptidase [Thermoanaerobaculia bacterium]|jgi:membrane protease YdiL (CAAX protease family)
MNPRREILIFLNLTLLLSSGFYLYLWLAESPTWNDTLSFAFMWCPGVAAILTRLITVRSLRGLGWGWGGTRRVLLPVFALPFLLAGAVYVLVWTLGLGAFDGSRLDALAERLGLPGTAGEIAMIALIPLGVALSMSSTLGEELGWRGLLSDRLLRKASFVRTSLLVGVIWSVWHYPLIFAFLPRFRPGLPVAYATACFTASVVGVSFFYTWLRQTTGSVWPAAILHAASNNAQTIFEALTRNTGRTYYFTYEYGIGFVLAIWILLALFWKRFSRRTDLLPAITSPA